MKIEEFNEILDNIGLELDGDLCIIYRQHFIVGRAEVNLQKEGTNEECAFISYCDNGEKIKILNPIAMENKLKKAILKIKNTEVEVKLEKMNRDFI